MNDKSHDKNIKNILPAEITCNFNHLQPRKNLFIEKLPTRKQRIAKLGTLDWSRIQPLQREMLMVYVVALARHRSTEVQVLQQFLLAAAMLYFAFSSRLLTTWKISPESVSNLQAEGQYCQINSAKSARIANLHAPAPTAPAKSTSSQAVCPCCRKIIKNLNLNHGVAMKTGRHSIHSWRLAAMLPPAQADAGISGGCSSCVKQHNAAILPEITLRFLIPAPLDRCTTCCFATEESLAHRLFRKSSLSSASKRGIDISVQGLVTS